MRHRAIGGLIAAVIGLFLIIYSINLMRRATDEKGFKQDVENFFTHNPMWNPLIEFFGGEAQTKPPSHTSRGMGMLVSGVILILGGSAAFFFYRKR